MIAKATQTVADLDEKTHLHVHMAHRALLSSLDMYALKKCTDILIGEALMNEGRISEATARNLKKGAVAIQSVWQKHPSGFQWNIFT